jgi:thymidylate synthase (FAD)
MLVDTTGLQNQKVEVTLVHHTPLYVCSDAVRTAWDSHDKSDTVREEGNIVTGEADRDLIYRVGNKFKHSSTLEHLVYTFKVKNFCRAVLQESARHRIASRTVKSTRYTLKELKGEEPFSANNLDDFHRAAKYVRFIDNEPFMNDIIIKQLELLRLAVSSGKANDITKLALPESYLTEEYLTINARSLQNFLALRSDKSAFWLIREVAQALYDALPDEHKYLFTDFMYKG